MRKYGYLLTVLIVMLYAGQAVSEPVVSGVQWVGEDTIRITGSAFGAKIPAAPEYWADFEGSTEPTNLGVQSNWSRLIAEHVTTNRGNISTGALRSDFSAGREDARGPYLENFDYDKMYVHFKRYYDFDITQVQGPVGFNIKVNRLWSETFGGGAPYGNNLYMSYEGKEGLKSGRAYNEYTSTGGATWFPTKPFKPKTWQTEQLIYQAGNVNVKDGIFNWIRDGEYIWSEDHRWQMRNSSRPYKYNILVFDQVSNGTAPGPIYVYYDNIYIDKTWARVMLCDSNTWSSCTQQEIQIPISWTDSQIEAKINFGDLDLKSPIYAYVVDANGIASPVGKLLPNMVSIPSAPTNFNVVASP